MTIKPLPPARQGNAVVAAAVVLWKRRVREGMRGRRLGSLVQASLEWRVLGSGRRGGVRPWGVRPARVGLRGDRSAFEGASAAAASILGDRGAAAAASGS
jgi:hypothetical protein